MTPTATSSSSTRPGRRGGGSPWPARRRRRPRGAKRASGRWAAGWLWWAAGGFRLAGPAVSPCLPVCLTVRLSVDRSFCILFVSLSVRLSVCSSLRLRVCQRLVEYLSSPVSVSHVLYRNICTRTHTRKQTRSRAPLCEAGVSIRSHVQHLEL